MIDVAAVLAYVIIMSLPGSKEENVYGIPTRYSSLWGSMLGSHEAQTVRLLLKRFIVPVIYVQGAGLITAFSVHTILPRISVPDFSGPSIEAGAALKETPVK
jgi:hypothetical protein